MGSLFFFLIIFYIYWNLKLIDRLKEMFFIYLYYISIFGGVCFINL
jgi:hypothetical protein